MLYHPLFPRAAAQIATGRLERIAARVRTEPADLIEGGMLVKIWKNLFFDRKTLSEWILQFHSLCIIMQMTAEKCKTGVKSGLRGRMERARPYKEIQLFTQCADGADGNGESRFLYFDQYEET